MYFACQYINNFFLFVYIYIVPTGEPLDCRNTTFLSRTVIIHWMEPERTSLNGVILGYYLQCEIMDTHQLVSGINDTLNSQITNYYTILYLTPFTSYVCNLSVINEVGTGPETKCVFETQQDSK